jgi:hypothetical protein
LTIIAYIRGAERYILLFDDEHKAEALRTLGRWACNPGLAFDWFDAAKLALKVKEELCRGK